MRVDQCLRSPLSSVFGSRQLVDVSPLASSGRSHPRCHRTWDEIGTLEDVAQEEKQEQIGASEEKIGGSDAADVDGGRVYSCQCR